MKLKTLFFGMLIAAMAHAQIPSGISYQSVLRDTSGTLLVNQAVGIQITLLQGSTSGTVVFSETHSTSTNGNGLITLAIGQGTPGTGDLASVDWLNGPFFIKTEIDPSGGSSYTLSTTNALNAVPYAYVAGIADSLQGGEQDPNFSGSAASGITGTDISNWNAKLDAEVDPSYAASVAAGITSLDTARWNDNGSGGISPWTETDSSLLSNKFIGINTNVHEAQLAVQAAGSPSLNVAIEGKTYGTGTFNYGTRGIALGVDPNISLNVGANGIAAGSSIENWGGNFVASSDSGAANYHIGSKSVAQGNNAGLHIGVWAQGGNSNEANLGQAHYGVVGVSSDANSGRSYHTGVYGFAKNNASLNMGVDGTAASETGDNIGTGGYAYGATDGTNKGIYGYAQQSSDLNIGVEGEADAEGTNNYGVQGLAEGNNGNTNIGVRGVANNSTFLNRGLEGFTTGTGATNIGVTGSSQGGGNGTNIGLSGFASNGLGNTYGVKGLNSSPGALNFGGHFLANGVGSGTNYGLWAEVMGSSSFNAAVYARSSGIAEWNYGVQAEAIGSDLGILVNVGMSAKASGSFNENWGGYFEANGEAGNANWNIGAKTIAQGGNQGHHVGLWSQGGNNTNGIGVYNANFGAVGLSVQIGSDRNNHVGLYGHAKGNSNNNMGVDGTADSETGNNTGIGGFAYGTTTGFNRGLHAYVNKGGASNYAIYAEVDNNSGSGTVNYSGYFKGAPVAVEDDNVYIKDFSKGVVLTSPDGTCWQITVDNAGNLTTTSIPCPN